MKTWHWCWWSALAGALAVLLLALALWFGHGRLARSSKLRRQVLALREQVYHATSQTYGQLDPYMQRQLEDQSQQLWTALDQRRATLPPTVSTRLVIANSSVLEWLRHSGSEPLRQQAVRDLDRALAVTP